MCCSICFLDEQINGMVVSYMTCMEAYFNAETMRLALSSLSTPTNQRFVAKDVELSEKLWCAIENYDRRCTVLLHVSMKVQLRGIEEGEHFFIHRWVVANYWSSGELNRLYRCSFSIEVVPCSSRLVTFSCIHCTCQFVLSTYRINASSCDRTCISIP